MKLNRYYKAKEEGLCVKCCLEKATDGIMCDKCKEESRDYCKQQRVRRNAMGLCQRCGNRDVKHGVLCEVCYDRQHTYSKSRKQKLMEKGLCVQCSKEKHIVGQVLCEKCKTKNKERRERRKQWMVN